jgi:glycosyltransferase involved in cell wall biosynthesis
VRVLIFHGYLLRGTGSNVYNASLARALAHLGHEVHLLCQDREAATLDWVDRVGRWRGGRLEVEATGEGTPPGSITVYVPEIGGLLPVFVADRYEGFEVKTFPQLTEGELDRYLSANVQAVLDVVESLGGVDSAVASHLVMGPVVLARAGLGFALKVHGSDLSYTVLPHLPRFGPYAEEGASAAAAILASTAHVAARVLQAVPRPEVEAKIGLVPPGVDTSLFAPIPRAKAAPRLRDLAASLEAEAGRGASTSIGAQGTSWNRDPERAAAALRQWSNASGPRVVFVGKLIVSKGIDLLLAAWPLVHRANPGARMLIVAFGEYERAAMRLWAALQGGDLGLARRIALRGRALEGGQEAPLGMLLAFLAEPPRGYMQAAARAADTISFAGRLEHEEVGRLVPAADVLVVPSTFPESFGMVAAEAASAGVPPVSAQHSGLAEVSQALADELPPDAASLLSFELDERAVRSLAERLNGWLGLDPRIRERTLDALRDAAVRKWSWEGVARGILAAAAGRLDELRKPPA